MLRSFTCRSIWARNVFVQRRNKANTTRLPPKPRSYERRAPKRPLGKHADSSPSSGTGQYWSDPQYRRQRLQALSNRVAGWTRFWGNSKVDFDSSTSQARGLASFARWFFLLGLNVFLVHYLWTKYICITGNTRGPSMMPCIDMNGSWVIISKLHREGRGVGIGDLVNYYHPILQGERGIKRVIGMPGDFVLRDTPGKGDGVLIRVPQGHCWIVGDNLDVSRDSRMFGPLPLALIRGKVILIKNPVRNQHGKKWIWLLGKKTGLEDQN